MRMDPAKLIDWLRLPQRVLWGFVVVIALILWGPDWFVSGLGLEEFIEEYRHFIGVFFLFFLVAAIPNTLHSIWQYCANKWRMRQWATKAIARLHDLTPQEKEVLKGFIGNNTRTRNLDLPTA